MAGVLRRIWVEIYRAGRAVEVIGNSVISIERETPAVRSIR
ncbi:hypothetical protein CKA32_004353 [Geitlerinema sp. FC II]|nr:hypothetical protein CKA32_004353 [Geitlerinema sp. FC II]